MHDHPGDCPYDIEDDVVCLGEFGDVTPEETATKDGKKNHAAVVIMWILVILIMAWFTVDLYSTVWSS